MLEFLNRVTYGNVVSFDMELFTLADGSELCDLTVEFGAGIMPPDEHEELLEIVRDFESGYNQDTIIGSDVYELVDNKVRLTVLYHT